MPYQKKRKAGEKRTRREWYVRIPNRHGGRVARSARTTNKKTAAAYEIMLDEIGPKGTAEFDLLDRVLAGDLSLAALYKAWTAKKLDTLREPEPAQQAATPDPASVDEDLDPLVDEWKKGLKDHVAPNTAGDYAHAVRLLIPAGTPFPVSKLTKRRLSEWMANMDGKPATKHYRWSGLRHFLAFLKEREVLSHNPADGIKRPKLPDPRLHYLDSPADCIRLAERQEQPFRDFSILIHGTGADVSAALKVRRRDVVREHKEVFCPGTKNYNRKRVVRVAEWAWPYIERRIAGLRPDDLLFDPAVIDRIKQWRKHVAAVEALVADGYTTYAGYTPRDSRHTYAVRAVRAGVPAEVVGRQLGHKDGRMVTKVYGRFAPRQSERDHWERIATERERELAREQSATRLGE